MITPLLMANPANMRKSNCNKSNKRFRASIVDDSKYISEYFKLIEEFNNFSNGDSRFSHEISLDVYNKEINIFSRFKGEKKSFGIRDSISILDIKDVEDVENLLIEMIERNENMLTSL